MQEEYGVQAFLMCREQYGVDAYTVWGGYYNQGYYPAKNNVMCPAQSEENMVKAPIFKMLGSDPIYCYDESEFEIRISDCCATMEPVWKYGNTDYIFKNNLDAYYKEECMDFAYTTIGQENSFGWDEIKKGLPMQLEEVARRAQNGEITVMKACDTGRWFCNRFEKNPTVSLISHDDWSQNGLESIWFACENYRANLFCDNGMLYFRDINKFDERYNERYLYTPCETLTAYYDNLPVADGRLWNDDGVKSGLKFTARVGKVKTEKIGDNLVCTAMCDEGEIRVEFLKESIKIFKPESVGICFERGRDFGTVIKVKADSIRMEHLGFDYEVGFSVGITPTEKGYELLAQTNTIWTYMDRK